MVAWLAAARIGAISVPISTFSTRAELAGLLTHADVGVLVSASAYRSNDFVAALGDAVAELDLHAAPPLMAPSTPLLRRIAFPGGETDGRVGESWTFEALVAEGAADDRRGNAGQDAGRSPHHLLEGAPDPELGIGRGRQAGHRHRGGEKCAKKTCEHRCDSRECVQKGLPWPRPFGRS